MKRIILVGKANEAVKELNEILSRYFEVQRCSDNVEIIKGMLQIAQPDLIIVSLHEISLKFGEIFPLLSRAHWKTPVLVIGSAKEGKELASQGRLSSGQLHFIKRPIKKEEVLERARELLRVRNKEEKKAEKKTILMVDDNPMLLRSMQGILSRLYKVKFATSGPQAIASIATEKPDLILLDYEMPVCDGKMTFQMLRSEEDTKDIPVVFLTGIAEASHVKEVLRLKPQGYLLKPPTEQKLFSTIAEALNQEEEEEEDDAHEDK